MIIEDNKKNEKQSNVSQNNEIVQKNNETPFVPVHIFMQYWDGEDLVDGIKK